MPEQVSFIKMHISRLCEISHLKIHSHVLNEYSNLVPFIQIKATLNELFPAFDNAQHAWERTFPVYLCAGDQISSPLRRLERQLLQFYLK